MRLPSSPEELLSYLDKRLEEIEDGQPITDRKAVKQVALKLIKQVMAEVSLSLRLIYTICALILI
jgi:hypothetical protein